MFKKFFTFLNIVFVFFTVSAHLMAEESNPRVAVLAFNAQQGATEDEAKMITQIFETSIIQTGVYTVVKQSAVDLILSAQEYSIQDNVDKEYAVKIGKMIAARLIFMGELIKLPHKYLVNIQLIDIEKGTAVRADSAEAASIEGLLDVTKILAARFAETEHRVKAVISSDEKVLVYVKMGDKFSAQREYKLALEQYEKALALDEMNVLILKKIINVKRDVLLSGSLYSHDAIASGLDIALRNDYMYVKLISKESYNQVMEQIMMMKVLEPSLENDISLLLDEVDILKAAGEVSKAIELLEKARKLPPQDPQVLAELGLLYGLKSYLDKKGPAGLDLLHKAISLEPENPLFHFYLGRSLERDRKVLNPEAIREYRLAAELAFDPDYFGQQIRLFASQSLQRYFYYLGSLENGILTKELDMSYEERLSHMEFLVANKIQFYSQTMMSRPDIFLAQLYYATGQYMKADKIMRGLSETDSFFWKKRKPWLELYAKILKAGGHDREMLEKVQNAMSESE